jgi:hypothetical protein
MGFYTHTLNEVARGLHHYGSIGLLDKNNFEGEVYLW